MRTGRRGADGIGVEIGAACEAVRLRTWRIQSGFPRDLNLDDPAPHDSGAFLAGGDHAIDGRVHQDLAPSCGVPCVIILAPMSP